MQHNAIVIAPGGEKLAEGMPLRISGQETAIASATTDEYGRTAGIAEVALPDGRYEGEVVTETVHAIDFLIESR